MSSTSPLAATQVSPWRRVFGSSLCETRGRHDQTLRNDRPTAAPSLAPCSDTNTQTDRWNLLTLTELNSQKWNASDGYRLLTKTIFIKVNYFVISLCCHWPPLGFGGRPSSEPRCWWCYAEPAPLSLPHQKTQCRSRRCSRVLANSAETVRKRILKLLFPHILHINLFFPFKEKTHTSFLLPSLLLRNMECFHCRALSLEFRFSTSSSLSCSSISWKAFFVRILTMIGLGSKLVLSAFSMDNTWWGNEEKRKGFKTHSPHSLHMVWMRNQAVCVYDDTKRE